MADEDPVFADERHHVGHRGQCHQVEQMVRKVGREAERGNQCLHQLEGDAGAAEPPRPRRVVRALRIDDGERRRQLGTGQMVVGDDDPDTGGPGRAHRVHGGDAAVAGDHERRARPLRRC